MSPSYQVKISKSNLTPSPLPMGGTNPQGETIAANHYYLTKNGHPWLPVMGEFHFSRYPCERWEEEILKMKAGGITVVATYIFWIHIEEIEGQFDWSGSRDLRRFISLCGKHGLHAYPRIGPWAHGECRNGGFPDWLQAKCGSDVRKDVPLYLSYVRRFYTEINQQLEGLLWKDGGPVIGIQIENELLNNAAHIRTLHRMAREVGLNVPLYTMTGWGPAEVPDGGEIIPVFGGYPDAFWDRQVEGWSRASRKHYFFTCLRDDNTIGADLNQRSDTGDLSHLSRFPYGTCETGGGMQVAYHRRPVIQPDDVAALATVKIGNGSNMQGYYMYHGGANPIGRLSTLQESQETGYPNDLPVINYDFQAPLGQYGQVRESYHALRPLHLFLNDFGSLLAPLPMILPDQTPADLDDLQTLRWAVRSDGNRGFVFINNYQRVESLPMHEAVRFHLNLPGEAIRIPSQPVSIPSGAYCIWPFNLDLGSALLKYASAQLVCRVEVENAPCYVFFAPEGIESEFVFDASSVRSVAGLINAAIEGDEIRLSHLESGTGCLFSLTTLTGTPVHILLLSQGQARRLWKATIWGQDRLFLSSDSLFFDDEVLYIQAEAPGNVEFSIFPAPASLAAGKGQALEGQPDGAFTRYFIALPGREIPVDLRKVQPAAPGRVIASGPAGVAQAPDDADFANAETWQIRLPADAQEGQHEILLQIDYAGDAARAYLGDRLIDDDFFSGRAWEVGLSRFIKDALEKGITLRFLPMPVNPPIYLPDPPIAAQEILKTVRVKRVQQVRIHSI